MTVIYTNLLSLSPRILDTLNVYVQPLFGLFTLVCSLLCAIVFASSRLKGVTYQHLFLDALASAVYGLSNSWTFIIRCGALCMYGYNYWSKFYEVNCYIYIGKSLELFVLLLEIHLSYLRIASFSKEKKGKDWIPMYVRFVIFFVVAFSTCVPVVILPRSINLTGYLALDGKLNATINNTLDESYLPLYLVVLKEKTSVYGYILLGISILQGVGLLLVLIAINLILLYMFRRFILRKMAASKCKNTVGFLFQFVVKV